MDDEMGAIETISFIVRSESRVRILERLLHAGSATQRELRTELDASRSTVARSLSAFEEYGWVEHDAGSYRLTPIGSHIIEGVLELVETVRTTDELASFAAWFPFSEFELDIEQLQDVEITSHTDGDPYAPGRAQTEFLRTAGRFRGFLSSIDLEGTKLVHEQIVNEELDAEIVVSPDVERTIETGEFAPLFREQIETGRLTVLVADGNLPFYLGVAADCSVQIGVEDDDGFPRALLESSDGSVSEWAKHVYREYRASARTKPIEEF